MKVVAERVRRRSPGPPYRRPPPGIQATSGRHGGCRLLIGRNGSLLVAPVTPQVGTNPGNRNWLNGKVARLEQDDRQAVAEQSFIDCSNRNRRYVLTWGHRNVQGLATRGDGTVWSAKHGPDVQRRGQPARPGQGPGWNPVPVGGGAGYNENIPMTDHSLPGPQRSARWRSGNPTIATSGASWVRGKQWGALNGTLAVAALRRATKVIFMRFNSDGVLRHPYPRRAAEVRPAALDQQGNGN